MDPSEANKEPPKKSEWTPESVENLIRLIDTLADKYVTYKRDQAEADRKYADTVATHNRWLTVVLAIVMGAIVAFMSWLALATIVSGDALLFLVGTITGYIILFIQRLVFAVLPSRPSPAAEE